MVSRARDWLRQAIKDYEHAKTSLEVGDYKWACFASHQAADKAVKALYQSIGVESGATRLAGCSRTSQKTLSRRRR